MLGHEGMDRGVLDAASVVGHLVDPGSMFAFLSAHRGEMFPDGMFADLFSSDQGPESIPGSVMASVMTLQTLHDCSDRETAEEVRCDLRWKVACGLSLDDAGFHPTTLVYWRRRLAASDRPHRISDAVKTVIAQTGVLRGRRRRAVDSTILADAVATQDTITQLIAAVRRVARVVPGAGEVVTRVCTGHDYSTPGKPKIDWDDPDAKDALVSTLVNDATALVNALADNDNDTTGEESEAVALLALVAGQDVEPAEGSDGTDGRWKIASRVAEDRVISTVDPEARHTRKSPEARRDGYRVHLACEPGTGLITDEELTKAAGPDSSDPAIAETFLVNDTTNATDTNATGSEASDSDLGDDTSAESVGTGNNGGSAWAGAATPAQGADAGQGQLEELVRSWFADSAYGTGDLRAAIAAAGHRAVIKPKPLQVAVAGGFSVDDFTVDAQAGTVTCPNQTTRPISPGRVATFGVACRACPLAGRCTTCKTGRKIVLHEHDDRLRAARQEWAANPDLRTQYAKHRPNVERTIAQVATRGGRRLKLRYRGTFKNKAWLKRRAAALNLRNLIGRGLDHVNGTWIVATT